jgi:hypothetical protein
VSGQHCLLAEGDISAPIYWHTDAPHTITIGGPMVLHILLVDRTEERGGPNSSVRLAHIFKPIAFQLIFTNRKQKNVEEKTTATLKIKQTSIATVRNHILTVACFLTPPPFSLPTSFNVIL